MSELKTEERLKEERYSLQKLKLDILGALTAAAGMLPLALAFGATSPLGAASGIMGAVVCGIVGIRNPKKVAMPNTAIFLILFYAVCSIGITGTMLACAIAGMFLMFAASLQFNKKFFRIPASLLSSISLAISIALCITQVNKYFGIGVPYATAMETLSAYRSFGFHANWRGVLYGTITLVIMITYPIKFKKLSRRLPASILSLVGTTLLNFALNPNAQTTAIDEVGDFPRFLAPIIGNGVLFNANVMNLLSCLPYAAALIIIYFTETLLKEDNIEKIHQSLAFKGLSAVLASATSGIVGGEEDSYGATRLTGIYSAFIVLAAAVAGYKFLVRVPTATLAVIIICTGFKSVRKEAIKKVFSSRKRALNLFIFFSVLIASIIGNVVFVIDIVAVFVLINSIVVSKKRKKRMAKVLAEKSGQRDSEQSKT